MDFHTFYTVGEAAKLLGLAVATLHLYRSHETGPKYGQVGPHPKSPVVYHIRDLEAWCAEREQLEAERKNAGRKRKLVDLKTGRRITKKGKVDRRQGWSSIASRRAKGTGNE